MNKHLYLATLDYCLAPMEEAGRAAVLRDYEARFAYEAGIGKTDEEIIGELGDPTAVAAWFLKGGRPDEAADAGPEAGGASFGASGAGAGYAGERSGHAHASPNYSVAGSGYADARSDYAHAAPGYADGTSGYVGEGPGYVNGGYAYAQRPAAPRFSLGRFLGVGILLFFLNLMLLPILASLGAGLVGFGAASLGAILAPIPAFLQWWLHGYGTPATLFLSVCATGVGILMALLFWFIAKAACRGALAYARWNVTTLRGRN